MVANRPGCVGDSVEHNIRQADANFWQSTASVSHPVVAYSVHDSSHRPGRHSTVIRRQSGGRLVLRENVRVVDGRAIIDFGEGGPAS